MMKSMYKDIRQLNEPIEVFIKNKIYFSVDDLYNYDNDYFEESCDNLNNIVTIKNIPKSNILYVYTSDSKTFIFQEIYIKLKLYIESEWVFENLPKMIQLREKYILIIKNLKTQLINSVLNEKSCKLYKILLAPNILELTENEMFKDNNNNKIKIELRGEKIYNKCYFNSVDIKIGFNLPNLIIDIINNNNDTLYICDRDYVIFNYINVDTMEINKNKIYFTYNGILRVLYINCRDQINDFITWYETIFVKVNICNYLLQSENDQLFFKNKELILENKELKLHNIKLKELVNKL